MGKKTVLIVDDDANSAYLLEKLFEGKGYGTIKASDGNEALDKLHEEKVDLIITDSLMPRMDGFQFCYEVKKTDDLKNIPLIFYSGTYADEDSKNLALRLGAELYLIKPLDPEKIIKHVEDIFQKEAKGEKKKDIKVMSENEFLRSHQQRLVQKLQVEVKAKGEEQEVLKKDLILVNKINLAANKGNDLLELIRLITDETKKSFSSTGLAVYLYDREKNSLVLQNVNIPKGLLSLVTKVMKVGSKVDIKLKEDSIYKKVIDSGEALILKDPNDIKKITLEHVQNKAQVPLANLASKLIKVKSTILVPMLLDEDLIGVLDISRDSVFSEEERRRITMIANQLAGIIKRKNLEDSSIRNEEYLNLVFNSTDAGIVTFDSDGRLKTVNKAALTLVDLEEKDLLGKRPEDLVGELTVDNKTKVSLLKNFAPTVFSGKAVEPFEWEFTTKKGKKRIVSTSVSPVTKRSKFLGLIAILRDVTSQKKAEDKFRALFKLAPDAFYIVDQKGVFLDLNEAAEKVSGYKKEEIVGKTIMKFNILPPDQMKLALKEMVNFFQGKTLGPLEYTLNRKDGTQIPVEVVLHTTIMEGKKVYFGIVRDISERKKTEESIRESEEKFKGLFQNMSNGVAIYEPVDNCQDFIIRDINPAGEKISNVKKEEIVGKRIKEVFPGVEEMNLLRTLRESCTTGKPQYHPITQYDDKRLKLWVTNYIFRLPDGNVVAVYDDITMQKESENALKQSEQKFRRIVINSPFPIMIIVEGQITQLNNIWTELTGYTKEDIPTVEKWTTLAFGKKAEYMKKRIESLYDIEERKNEGEFRVKTKEGSYRTWDISFAPLYKTKDGKNQIICVAHDVTDKKLAEKKAKVSLERFEDLTNLLPQTIFEIDLENKLTYINKYGITEFQYTQAEIDKGLEISNFIVDVDADRLEGDLQLILSGKEPKNRTYIAIRKDKSTFPVSIYANAIMENKKKIGVRGIILDISEIKKAEQKLKDKVSELERMSKLMVGREIRIAQLKRKMENKSLPEGETPTEKEDENSE